MEYIELRPFLNVMIKQNILDFNSEYFVEEISNTLMQEEINKLILNLRQKYYINKYKDTIEYISLYIPFLYEDYDIAQVYGLNFDQLKFNTLRRLQFCEYAKEYDPNYDDGFPGTPAHVIKERIQSKINKGIMNYIAPEGYCTYKCKDGTIVYPSFKKRDFIENITNLYNEFNFVKFINTENGKFLGVYPSSKFNPKKYFKIAKSVYESNDIENQLQKYNNTVDKYFKMFEYNMKKKDVLYITDQFKDDMKEIEFGYKLDDFYKEDLELEFQLNISALKEFIRRSKEEREKNNDGSFRKENN